MDNVLEGEVIIKIPGKAPIKSMWKDGILLNGMAEE